MAKKDIEFDSDALELVNELAENINANNTVQFVKKDEHIHVTACDASELLAYALKAPASKFDFIDELCTFYSFPEFHTLLKMFDSPSIVQEDKLLTVKEKRSRIKFLLSNDELVDEDERLELEDWETTDVSLKWSKEDISKIVKMRNAIESEKIRFSIKGEKTIVTLFSDKHENAYSDEFEVRNDNGVEFTVTFDVSIFTMIPVGDYTMNFNEEGFVQFVMKRDDDIDLKLYAGQMIEE